MAVLCRHLRKTAPAAANLKDLRPPLETERIEHQTIFGDLARLQALGLMPEEGRGIAHRLIKPNRVEFVAKIIVSTDVAARAGLGVGPSEMEQPVDHALVEHGPCRLVQRFAVLQVKAQDGRDVTAFDITRHVAFGKADGAAADSTPDWPEILELQIAGGAGFGVSDPVHLSGRQCEGNAAGDITGQEFPPQCGDGVTEITLLGQTVNAYGRDLGPGITLGKLLRALHEIPSLRRLAFITSHPNFLSEELIVAIAELPKVARYLHLPVQSGSDRMLKAMRRGYTRERYLKRVGQLLAKAPDMELHSDFIVGYPGETEADFEESASLMRQVGYAQSYIFQYSPRPGTVAAELVDDVPKAEKERRNQVLLAIQDELCTQKHNALVGTTQEVLVEGESPKDASRLTGRTVHHRIVHFNRPQDGGLDLVGRYVPVRIEQAMTHSLIGVRLAENEAEHGRGDREEHGDRHAHGDHSHDGARGPRAAAT